MALKGSTVFPRYDKIIMIIIITIILQRLGRFQGKPAAMAIHVEVIGIVDIATQLPIEI
jgi:hypothetical protein